MKVPNEANIDTMLSKTKGYVDSEISKVNNELDDKQDKLTFDTTPTTNSNNPVTSGGLYSALALKQDTMTALSNAQIDTIMDAILV